MSMPGRRLRMLRPFMTLPALILTGICGMSSASNAASSRFTPSDTAYMPFVSSTVTSIGLTMPLRTSSMKSSTFTFLPRAVTNLPDMFTCAPCCCVTRLRSACVSTSRTPLYFSGVYFIAL